MYERYQQNKGKTYQLYHKYKEQLKRMLLRCTSMDIICIIPFVLLSLKVRLQYFYFLLSSGQGFPQSDDSKWYIHYAQSLIAKRGIGMHMDDILYFGYNVLLALLLAVFKDPITVIFVQTVTAALCVILVFKIARMLFNRTTAIIASFLYCYHAWSITLWSMYILSDSFFISLLLLCVYFLLRYMEANKNSHKILFIITSFYLLIFRPAGIITVIFIMMYLLINTHRKKMIHFVEKYRVALGVFVTAGAVILALLYAGGKLDPLISSMQFNAKKVLYNIYAKGWIYDMPSAHDHFYRPDYKINIMNSLIVSFIVNNLDHILVIYGRRIVAFLGRWVWETDFRSIQGIIRFAENFLPTALFLAGTIAAIKNGLFRKASIVWLIILNVFVFCIVFFIDGMYRYKAPGIPFIAIVIAYGADRIIKGAVVIVKKYAGKWFWKKRTSATHASSGL